MSVNSVILGTCFTNIIRFYQRGCGSNLMVFPLFEDDVFYRFGTEKEYLVSNTGNLRVICPSYGVDFSANRAILFFMGNPFENIGRYREINCNVFQSSSDESATHSSSRKSLVNRAARAGLGSLDAFIKDEIWD